jgi:hypothetical protein
MLWATCFDTVWLIGVNEIRLTLLVLSVGISGVVRSMLGEQRSRYSRAHLVGICCVTEGPYEFYPQSPIMG